MVVKSILVQLEKCVVRGVIEYGLVTSIIKKYIIENALKQMLNAKEGFQHVYEDFIKTLHRREFEVEIESLTSNYVKLSACRFELPDHKISLEFAMIEEDRKLLVSYYFNYAICEIQVCSTKCELNDIIVIDLDKVLNYFEKKLTPLQIRVYKEIKDVLNGLKSIIVSKLFEVFSLIIEKGIEYTEDEVIEIIKKAIIRFVKQNIGWIIEHVSNEGFVLTTKEEKTIKRLGKIMM